MRVESQVTSVSWIPSESVTGYAKPMFASGVTHYDDPPPEVIGDRNALEALQEADRFRFANHLAAWAEFSEGHVVDHGVTGGLVIGGSTVRLGPLGVTFTAVGLPDLRPEPEFGDGYVRFTQTAGGRTALPFPRRIGRAPYVRLQPPLVWTTLTLTLRADGHAEVTLRGASPFPRHWVYGPDGKLALKAGLTDFAAWAAQEGPHRTPWGEVDSPVLVTAAETALERRLSTLIMRGGHLPTIRSLPAGEALVRQGETGRSLFLLLDGVLAVEVDGRTLAELGPGAILGERAVLEDGRRTATLTARTPVRVAEAPAHLIDQRALAELAAGHRREESLA